MKKHLLAVFALALVGCERPAPEPVVAPEPPKPTIYWTCDGFEFAAVPAPGGVELHLPNEEPFVVGDEVFLLTEEGSTLRWGESRLVCVAKTWGGRWEEARERGATFRAVGQEPGWLLEITDGAEILIGLDYGERALAAPTPMVRLLGGARGYQTEHAGQPLLVLIEDLPCFDTMSGEVFPETVTLEVQGVRYRGCGLTLD